ncbi:unnamed protein product [Caenorhabditis bovis]|uniref:Uncharacterized protein n=1 Tax=Caenorhabditis bovis TaxID=2654633 RepID=A0A8S1EL43_9PELO|nr:unnamed protein product [Caenorhabditis bovis]
MLRQIGVIIPFLGLVVSQSVFNKSMRFELMQSFTCTPVNGDWLVEAFLAASTGEHVDYRISDLYYYKSSTESTKSVYIRSYYKGYELFEDWPDVLHSIHLIFRTDCTHNPDPIQIRLPLVNKGVSNGFIFLESPAYVKLSRVYDNKIKTSSHFEYLSFRRATTMPVDVWDIISVPR